MNKDYFIKRKVISKQFASFLHNYIILKKQVLETYLKYQRISPFNDMHGALGDQMIPDTFNLYGDTAFDTLLTQLLPIMNKSTGLKLIPTYSYARIYKKGDILKRHIDRKSCEYSTTLHLGGDEWPIFLEPSREKNKKGIEIALKAGDMLVYKGCNLEHWREEFTKNACTQVFLHYNLEKDMENIFDGRIHLGLPKSFLK
jgi:hypothetical protein